MESGGSAFDFSDTRVYFSSYDALVPFKNPSDAAIARLSTQKGVTLAAVQAVLDLIVFNPSFNSREVTLSSTGSIDETVAEYRETQVLRRACVGGEETASSNGATSLLAINLVVSQIKKGMGPFLQAGETAWWSWSRYYEMLLMNMSLVHRSWTMSAQELLFRRVLGTNHRGLVWPLLQHPFCSRIRELHLGVWCMSDDDLDRFALLLRRIPSLRRLSLDVSSMYGFTLAHRDDIYAKIYSETAPHLPILAELRIHHDEITLLEDCAKCILQRGYGAAPFILKKFSISYDQNLFRSEMLLSPAQLRPIVHHETPHYPSTYSSPQVPNSQDISKCSITVGWSIEERLLLILVRLFDTGGVLEGILPQISHFTFYLWRSDGETSFTDNTAFRSFFARFLGKCTSMAHMSLFVDKYSDEEMLDIPFSSISKSLQVLSIYMYYPSPADANAQKRASGLERVVSTMRDRGAGSSLERIEVTFCLELCIPLETLQRESVKMSPPEYLDPVHRTCRELDIDLVCKIAE